MNLNPKNICISSIEKEVFQVDIRIAKFCKQIESTLEDASENEEIPLSIESEIIKLIIKYLENHKYLPIPPIPKPLPAPLISLEKIVGEFDYLFISSLNEENLHKLLLACGYLNFMELFDLCSAFIASKFIGKTKEEIMKEYDIKEELTDDVISKIQKDYACLYTDTKIN